MKEIVNCYFCSNIGSKKSMEYSWDTENHFHLSCLEYIVEFGMKEGMEISDEETVTLKKIIREMNENGYDFQMED